MIELTQWMRTSDVGKDTSWVVFGKGPTFADRHAHDLSDYRSVGLNHVVAEQQVDIAHIIDVEVVEDCADAIPTNCQWLLMPREPHVRSRPSYHVLDDFVEQVPVLQQMQSEGRLIWYNIETGHRQWQSPTVEVKYFSSEAALSILGMLGAKTVRSLGIDGGQGYSKDFSRLEGRTMLANSQPSFDRQFRELDRIAAKHGMDYAPMIEPVRVFVGLDRSQILAARVLEHSIREHTSLPVRFEPMLDVDVPMPKDRSNRPRTGFSFHRFAIPELCGYKGRAIYLDADMQVFSDIAELWNRPFGDAKVMVTNQLAPPPKWEGSSWFHPGPQMSVMVLDCASLDWDVRKIVADLDAGTYDYRDLMFDLCLVKPEEIDTTLPVEWNHLEHYVDGETKLLHYTVVPTQPWKTEDNELGAIWLDGLRSAAHAGTVPLGEVEDLIAEGHVRAPIADIVAEHLPTTPKRIMTSVEMELDATRQRLDVLEVGGASALWQRGRRVIRDGRYIFESWRRRSDGARALAARGKAALNRSS